MDPLVTERSKQSDNLTEKPVLCMLGLLSSESTIIMEREHSDQENANQGKIALAEEHN